MQTWVAQVIKFLWKHNKSKTVPPPCICRPELSRLVVVELSSSWNPVVVAIHRLTSLNSKNVGLTEESTRDLGVFVPTNFKPSVSVRLAVSRARARLFQLRRGFVVMTKEAFLPLYLSLIHPILEYAIQAVSPYLQNQNIRISEYLMV